MAGRWSYWWWFPVDMAADAIRRLRVFAGAFVVAYGVQWLFVAIWLSSVLRGQGVDRVLDSAVASEDYLPDLAERFAHTSALIAALAATGGVNGYRYFQKRRRRKREEDFHRAIEEARSVAAEPIRYTVPEHMAESAERMADSPLRQQTLPHHGMGRTEPAQPRRDVFETKPIPRESPPVHHEPESIWTQIELPKDRPETRNRT